MIPYPIEKRVAKIKEKYPSALVFSMDSVIGDDFYLLLARPLNMEEVQQAMQIAERDLDSAQEWVTDLCLDSVWSYGLETILDDWGELPFTLSKQVFDSVMEKCSMVELEPLQIELNSFRESSESLFYVGARFIMSAIKQYSLSDVKKLTRTEFAELIVMSEGILGTPFEIVDPESQNSEEEDNQKLLKGIEKTAKENSKYLDFGDENEQLNKHM